jgi:DNA-binding CsgD family transcriptional regulator
MKAKQNLININRAAGFQLDPALTNEESIILRALASGRSDRQVCTDLRMAPATFLSLMRNMREKIGTSDNIGLIAWAKRQIKDGDQRVEESEGYGRLA